MCVSVCEYLVIWSDKTTKVAVKVFLLGTLA
jgi:hypothetical protein